MIDMRTPASPVPLDAMFIPSVVRQHVDDAAFLSTTRSGVTRAANIKLPDLADSTTGWRRNSTD